MNIINHQAGNTINSNGENGTGTGIRLLRRHSLATPSSPPHHLLFQLTGCHEQVFGIAVCGQVGTTALGTSHPEVTPPCHTLLSHTHTLSYTVPHTHPVIHCPTPTLTLPFLHNTLTLPFLHTLSLIHLYIFADFLSHTLAYHPLHFLSYPYSHPLISPFNTSSHITHTPASSYVNISHFLS